MCVLSKTDCKIRIMYTHNGSANIDVESNLTKICIGNKRQTNYVCYNDNINMESIIKPSATAALLQTCTSLTCLFCSSITHHKQALLKLTAHNLKQQLINIKLEQLSLVGSRTDT